MVVLFCSATFGQATTQPAAEIAPATQPALKASDFLRLVETAPAHLETADMLFVNNHGQVVRLVAAVHIAEKAYFADLAKDFVGRDAVLYEMVKPKDAPAPARDRPSNSTISELQRFMKNALNLEFQLDAIDYTQANFVHADLDAETFTRLQTERGETFEMIFFKQLASAMSHPTTEPIADTDEMFDTIVKLVTQPDSERQLKMMLARQMADMDDNPLGLGDNSVLIAERDKAAIEVLKTELGNGKKDLVIFYGAAHMPDLSKRVEALGFRPVSTQWHTAWDLAIRPDQPSAVEQLLKQVMRSMSDADR